LKIVKVILSKRERLKEREREGERGREREDEERDRERGLKGCNSPNMNKSAFVTVHCFCTMRERKHNN